MKWRLFKSQHYRAFAGSLSTVVYHNGADWSCWSTKLSWQAEEPPRCRTMKEAKAQAEIMLEEAAWTLAQPRETVGP